MGVVVAAGQRFAAIADMQVGEGNQSAAVGTTMALLERGSRVMSAIHKRLYVGMKEEFKLLAKVFSTFLPPSNILMMWWELQEQLNKLILMIGLMFCLLLIQIFFL